MKSYSTGRGYRAICAAVLVASGSAQFAHAQSSDDENGITEEVVVTGSRIAVDSATSSASPVVVLGGDTIRTAGQADLGELLRESPALNQSLPANFSAFQGPADGEAGDVDGDLGLGLLDLRGLGTNRTLVLVNGRRHVAGAQGSAAVDINTIPNNMISRVETLTGGASAVYGADAVTGVVNFVLRDGRDFDGLEFTAQSGISADNDAEEFLISGAGGFEFLDGKAEMVLGVEYLHNEEVFDSDRTYTGQFIGSIIESAPEVAVAAGLNPNVGNLYVRNAGNPISSPLGVFDLRTQDAFGTISSTIRNGRPGDAIPFIPGTNIPVLQVIDSPFNGFPRAYNPGLAVNTSDSLGVGDGLGNQFGTLFPEQDRVVVNLNGSYDFNENHSFFVESKYAYTENSERGGTADFNDNIPIAYDNPFIPDALAAQIALLQTTEDPDNPGEFIIPANPMDGSFYGFGASRDTSDQAVLPRDTVERETTRIVFGLEGELQILDGISYEISYNYGRTETDLIDEDERVEDRFYAALDTVRDPDSGEIVCRSDLDPTAVPPAGAAFPFPNYARQGEFLSFTPGDGSCVPFNPFGRDSATPEYAAWVYPEATDEVEIEQNVFFASLTGTTSSFFELPAGPIGWAGGFEYRDEESDFKVSALEQTGNTWIGSRRLDREPLEGDFDVTEWFFEVQAPLLEGLPGIEYLEITGAWRYADYSTIGTNDTWSIGGRWSPYPGFTFRSTFSQAVRAPNISELFSPPQPATYPFNRDPCSVQNLDNGTEFRRANCAALGVPDGYNVNDFITAAIDGVTGGNPNLAEETADTFTVGLVFEPEQWVPGLRIIIDYYDIEIDDAIDALSALRVSQACVDLPSINNNFCPLIDRDPTDGFITFHRSGQVNLGSFETSGFDFGINYDFELGDFGSMDVGLTGSHLREFDEFQDPIDTSVFDDRVGEFGFPEWIANLNARWYYENLSITWAARYEDSQNLASVTNRQIQANPRFIDPLNTGRGIVHDFNFGYDFSEQISVYGGLNNAFDTQPYLGTLSRPAGPRGRFFFAGVNFRM